MEITIRCAGYADRETLARFAAEVYEADKAEMAEEFVSRTRSASSGFLLAECGGEPIGFCELRLRRDYVEGTESSPVAYVEGICVAEEWRRRASADRRRARLGA